MKRERTAGEPPIYGKADRLAFERHTRKWHPQARIMSPTGRSADAGDGIYKTSISSAQVYMRNCFGSQNSAGQRFRVYPAFLSLNQASAFASFSDGVHLCAIQSGLVESLFELFMFCLSQRRLFRHIGDPDAERSPEGTGGEVPGLWMVRSGALGNPFGLNDGFWPFTPVDPSRRACALYMLHLTLRFVWFHELYHCLNGHVAWLNFSMPGLHLDEVADVGGEVRGRRWLRSLEFDADEAAAWASCKIQLNGTDNIIGIKPLPLDLRLKLLLFGIYCTTWLFSELNRTNAAHARRSHPKPYSRLHNIILCVADNISPLVTDLDVINESVLAECEELSSIIPSMFPGSQILTDMKDLNVYKTIHYYHKDLRYVRRLLEPHAYF